jgi:eukaryotic-like serine/threonine-protein kinase
MDEMGMGMHGSSVVLLTLVTSVLTATGTTYLVQRYEVFPPPQQAPVHQAVAPILVGLSEADARANTTALQLALLVEGREPSAGAAAGTVLRQSIAPGQPVPEGGGVGVVFAAPLPRVPKLIELSLAEAKEKLTRSGYKVTEGDTVPHPRVPAGKIVGQSPEPDAELPAGSAVTLHASSGPAELESPKLMGMALAAAKQKLSDLGLTTKVRWISKAETDTGVVLSQKPKPGQKLSPKATVEVVINR